MREELFVTLVDSGSLVLWEFSNEPVIKSFKEIKGDVIAIKKAGNLIVVLSRTG